MTPKSELRCILFPLILLEMFLQLNWSPPVINSIDWTWLGIANTCLYKVPQLTVHVRANSKPWGQRNYLQTSETGLCQGIDLEKGTEKSLQLYRSQRAQWPPSFVNGRSLEPPRIFLDLAARPNWAIGEDGPWPGRWAGTRGSLWQSSSVSLWRWENLSEDQPSRQHSTNQAFMLEQWFSTFFQWCTPCEIFFQPSTP